MAGAGVTAVNGAGRGSGTRGGVVMRLADGRRTPPALKPLSTGGGALRTACSGFMPARPSGVAIRSVFTVWGAGEPREAGADVIGTAFSTKSSLSSVELRRSRLGDGRRGSRGFGGARANFGGYGKNRSEIVVGCRQSPPAAGTAVDGWRRMQKHERRNSSKEQKGRQSSYVARVCENRKRSAEVKGAHPRQHVWCTALAHLSRQPKSARRECFARKPLSGIYRHP